MKMSYRKKSILAGYAFAAPGMIFAILYMGYPLVRSFYLSFTQYNFAFDPKPVFVGLNNYVECFRTPISWVLFKIPQYFLLPFFPA